VPAEGSSADPIRLVVLVGSAREGRLSPSVARWFLEQAHVRPEFRIDVVDVATSGLPDSLADGAPQAAALRPVLAAADAFVVIAPEYNRGIPGPLKTAIDSFNAEWQAKPVALVVYGLSLAGGVRAAENLRLVFGEFHSVVMKDSVVFPGIAEQFGPGGQFPADPQGSAAAAKVMLDQLTWWALALREAKSVRPFGA